MLCFVGGSWGLFNNYFCLFYGNSSGLILTNFIFLENIWIRQTVSSKGFPEISFNSLIAGQWVSLLWQSKNNTEPGEMFESHPNLTLIARTRSCFCCVFLGFFDLRHGFLSQLPLIYIWVILHLFPKWIWGSTAQSGPRTHQEHVTTASRYPQCLV